MKNKIIILTTLLLVSFGASAQFDRSIQPKAGPAPKIVLETPQTFKLKNGLKVLVVENHKLPRVSYSLTLDNPPIFEGDNAGISNLLGAMLGNGTLSISKDDFNEDIDFLGARLNFGAQFAFASCLSKYAERILNLMADAATNPLLTDTEFDKEKTKLIEGLKTDEKSVEAVASKLGSALAYGTQHPYGEFATKATVNNITIKNLRDFYKTNFTPNNAYLVIVGDVNFKTIKKQVTTVFKKWKKAPAAVLNIPNANSNVNATQINFIDMPEAVQSNVALTNTINLRKNHPDYHAVLIANKILGGGFSSYLNMNLREANGYTYGANSGVGTDKYISRFRTGTSVRNAVTDSAVVETLKEINRIKTVLVSDKDLKNAKAKYVGDFVLALESPQTVARYALNIKTENLPEDFYENYLEKINKVTAADVKRVANRYFKPEHARIIVVGKGRDVLENLEKIGIPITFYDTYGQTTSKPEFSKPIPSGITAQTVINSYLEAIGGKNKAEAVNTVFMTANVSIEGVPMPLTAAMKIMAPNKESVEMTAQGMGVLMKQKFNGTSGYTEQQGQKKMLTEAEIAKKKTENALFPELYYESSALQLESITELDGKAVYTIKVTENNQDSYRYYNVATGLLTQVETTIETQGQAIKSVITYTNYTETDGLQIPNEQTVKAGPQTIVMKITNVTLNKGVTEADFN